MKASQNDEPGWTIRVFQGCDSRDEGGDERLAILGGADGVWRCRTIFDCVEACPRDINITRAIGEVKKALLFRRL